MDRHLRPGQQLQDLIRRDALSRRDFLRVAASAGAVGAGVVLLGACSDDGKGSPASTPGTVVDPPPETTTIRLAKTGVMCTAPIDLAALFLAEEGFTDVQYIQATRSDHGAQQTAAGEMDGGRPRIEGVLGEPDRRRLRRRVDDDAGRARRARRFVAVSATDDRG